MKGGQNKSSAVMQQRHEAHDSLDDFPTPPWATRQMLAYIGKRHALHTQSVREPACNRGHMVQPLSETFDKVLASDVHDYGCGFPVSDYLLDTSWYPPASSPDWTITNPPFRLAEQFVEVMLRQSVVGVAVIVRIAFLESQGRYERLFSQMPPSRILIHAQRVPMCKGRYDPDGSTATAYVWLIWDKTITDGAGQTVWLPPEKDRFLRPGDASIGLTPTGAVVT